MLVGLGLLSPSKTLYCSNYTFGRLLKVLKITDKNRSSSENAMEIHSKGTCCHSESRKHRALANEQRMLSSWEFLDNTYRLRLTEQISESGQRGPLSSNDLILLLSSPFLYFEYSFLALCFYPPHSN